MALRSRPTLGLVKQDDSPPAPPPTRRPPPGGIVSPVVVCQRVAYQHCLIDGRTAGEYEPGGAAADEVTRLLHDMMTRLQPDTPAWRAV